MELYKNAFVHLFLDIRRIFGHYFACKLMKRILIINSLRRLIYEGRIHDDWYFWVIQCSTGTQD